MKTVLNPREHLGVVPENLQDFGIRLLYESDRPGQEFGPSSKSSPVVRRPEEDDTTGRQKDILEVLFWSLSRRN